jgi:hypothetical protein
MNGDRCQPKREIYIYTMKIHEEDEEQEYLSRMMGSLWVDFRP